MSTADRTVHPTPLGWWAARMGDRILFRAPCRTCRQVVVVRPSGVYSSRTESHRCQVPA